MENKIILLQHMEISQFKGVRQLALDFAPEENSLYGANAAGKTTVYDALLWLLLDKDSAGSSKFTVKPIDATRGVTPTVTACFLVDGQPLKLQKTLREKWEKHRGGENRFSGDTREYFVDDVPRKETEYKRIVSSYIDEKQFKLLTNLYAFARDMPWKDRRALMEEICDLPSDYEIASGAPQFTALLEVLQKCSIIDYKTKILNERKGINTKLNTLPIRIDECERQIAPLTTFSFQQAKENLCDFQSALQKAQAKLAGFDNGAALSQAKNEKRGLTMNLAELEFENQ